MVYLYLGQHETALAISDKHLSIAQKLDGENSKLYSESLSNYGWILQRIKRYGEAAVHFEKSYHHLVKIMGEKH